MPTLTLPAPYIGAQYAALMVWDGSNWVPLKSNSDGELAVNLEAASITIGKVDQGAAGASPWPTSRGVSIPSSQATLQNAQAGSDNGSTITVTGYATVVFSVTGTFTGTVNFECLDADGNVTSINCTQAGSNNIGPTATAAGIYRGSCSGFTTARARTSGMSGGSVTVKAIASPDPDVSRVVNANLAAGTAVVGKVGIDQTTPGTTNYTEGRVSCRRAAGVLHRSAVVTTDKLSAPTVSAASAITEAGSNLTNVAHGYTAAAGNRWGNTTVASVQTITPTANQAVRIPIAQVSGADYYDIFLSTSTTAPAWVGRITETQRATGGFIISTVGTVTAGGGAGAGAVDIGVVGTGLASNVAPFTGNNAYVFSGITPIDCSGYASIRIRAKLTVTDLRSLPTLTLEVFNQYPESSGDWALITPTAPSILNANGGRPLIQELNVTVNGATGVAVLVDTLTGQGASVDLYVDRF